MARTKFWKQRENPSDRWYSSKSARAVATSAGPSAFLMRVGAVFISLSLEALHGKSKTVPVDSRERLDFCGREACGGGAAARIREEQRALGRVRVDPGEIPLEGGAHAAAVRRARPAASAVRARSSSFKSSSKGG